MMRLLALLVAAVAVSGPPPVEATGLQARLRPFDPSLLETGDLIRYRALSREDFRASDPPPEAAGLHDRLGAASCVFLATDPDMFIRASARGLDLEFGHFRARIENLGFDAYLDRGCSWWNPAPLSLPTDYILQHEQIHFALFEIAALSLDSRAVEIAAELEAVAASAEGAAEVLQSRLDATLQRALEEVVARNNDFDRDTSLTYRQDLQSWWWNTVSVELERLRRSLRTP